MSLLYRNGTGRNNVAWGGGTTTAATYLRRTSSGRNNISYINISTSGTHNLLNRTSTGRNNIAWKNTTFNFGTNLSGYSLYTRLYGLNKDTPYNISWGVSNTSNGYLCKTINRNGYSNISKAYGYVDYDAALSTITIYYQKGSAQNVYNEILKSTKVTISGANRTGESFSYTGNLITSGAAGSGKIRISFSEYTEYSYISLRCDYTAYPGRSPNLQSITFS